jgi:hypothetical protein
MKSFPTTDRPAPAATGRTGFTLLETILALGVTFLIVTTAFGIVTSCMELGDTVRTSRTGREEKAAVEDLFRNFFSTLPQDSALECRVSGSSRAPLTEIRVQNAPALAGSILNPGPNEVLVIQTTEEPGGYLRLGVGISEGRLGTARAGPVSGFAVAGQIAVCRWRFFQADRNQWQEKWDLTMGRPRFVELTFAQTSALPERWVFPVPVFAAPQTGNDPQNPNPPADEDGDGKPDNPGQPPRDGDRPRPDGGRPGPPNGPPLPNRNRP